MKRINNTPSTNCTWSISFYQNSNLKDILEESYYNYGLTVTSYTHGKVTVVNIIGTITEALDSTDVIATLQNKPLATVEFRNSYIPCDAWLRVNKQGQVTSITPLVSDSIIRATATYISAF